MKRKCGIYAATVYQLAVALVMLWITRFGFALYNADLVAVDSAATLMRLAINGLRFDIPALLYFNLLFVLMRFVPFNFTQRSGWLKASNWVYGICNGLMLAINLADIPYYRFTGARLRWSNVETVMTDSGALRIMMGYVGDYWWAYALVALIVALTIWIAMRVEIEPRKLSVGKRVVAFVAVCVLVPVGIRGHVSPGLPVGIADVTFYVDKAPQINVVLNSPFTVIRSTNKKKNNTIARMEFCDDEELARMRDEVHEPLPGDSLMRRNVVTIVVESLNSMWLDSLGVLPGGSLGVMPFLDSLASRSTVVPRVVASSRGSIHGLTSIAMGFPCFNQEYFMRSPYNGNVIDSPARLLAGKGWDTAFFYGVDRGSFNIDQTAHASGYERGFNRETFGDEAQYDGMWGIYDLPMGQYVVKELGKMKEPFMGMWFTVSAHEPHNIPPRWDVSRYRYKTRSAQQALEYTDEALRAFFALAARQPWYHNTTFIITADHGNRSFRDTDYDGLYLCNSLPMIIYTPDGSMAPRRVDDRFVSQHDISATTLALVGYDEPYVSVSRDALDDRHSHFGISRTDGERYVVYSMPYIAVSDPGLLHVEELYNAMDDPTLKHKIPVTAQTDTLLVPARALMQSFTTRLNDNRLTIGGN